MATLYRLKGSTDFNASAYWGGSTPATADDLRIIDGADGFDTNTNQAAKDFASVWFDKRFGDPSTRIGVSGGPLTFDCDRTNTGVFKFQGQCAELGLAPGSGTSKFHRLEWSPLNATAKLLLQGSGTVTTLLLQRGQSVVNGGIAAPTIVVEGGRHIIAAHTAGTDVPNIVVAGGEVVLRRDWTSLKVIGSGVVYIELDAGVTGGTVEIGTDPDRGGVVLRQGDLGVITGYSGVLDESELQRAATAANANFYSRLTRLRRNGAAELAFTSGPTNFGLGPVTRVVG